jgi:hypothetical protein
MSDDYSLVLDEASSELARQESRIDVKSGHLATLAGTLSVTTLGTLSVIISLNRDVSLSMILSISMLFIASLLWASSVILLIFKIVRPQLQYRGPGAFVNDSYIDELRTMSLLEYREYLVGRLSGLVLRRYCSVRLASNLLICGFVPLIFSGLIFVFSNIVWSFFVNLVWS